MCPESPRFQRCRRASAVCGWPGDCAAWAVDIARGGRNSSARAGVSPPVPLRDCQNGVPDAAASALRFCRPKIGEWSPAAAETALARPCGEVMGIWMLLLHHPYADNLAEPRSFYRRERAGMRFLPPQAAVTTAAGRRSGNSEAAR